jgi:hypothetical protein
LSHAQPPWPGRFGRAQEKKIQTERLSIRAYYCPLDDYPYKEGPNEAKDQQEGLEIEQRDHS